MFSDEIFSPQKLQSVFFFDGREFNNLRLRVGCIFDDVLLHLFELQQQFPDVFLDDGFVHEQFGCGRLNERRT